MSQEHNKKIAEILDDHRNSLLTKILWLFVLVAVPVLLIAVVVRPVNAIVPLVLLSPVVIAAIYTRSDYRYRMIPVLAFLFLASINSLVINGVDSAGRQLVLLAVILTGLFFDAWVGIATILLFVACVAVIAFLIINGNIVVAESGRMMSSDPENWIFYEATFIGTSLLSFYAVRFLVGRLVEHLAELEVVIAQKDAAREAERKASELYRLLAENVHDVIWTMNLEGRITYISPSVERMRGVTPEQVLSDELPEPQAPNRQHRFVEALWEELALEESGRADPERYNVFETQIQRADGSMFDAEIVSSFMRDENGKPIGVLGVTRDITERRTLEQQLQQSQKMESVGQLAGGVAHDFNNLLQAILGYADLAKSKVGDNSMLADDIDEIVRAGDRAKSLVRQLLAFSRRQVLTLQEMKLSTLIRGVMKLLERVIGAETSIDFVAKHTDDRVAIDMGQIEQVLMNLCVNARDAMPDGGSITIETSDAFLDVAFCEANPWARPGRFIRMSVADTGTGIDAQTLEHIFEPFFTSKEQGKGTGLGLSTVFGIVRQHNGLIDVESTVGVGSVFHVYLPLLETSVTQVEEPGSEPPMGGTETILLADDDELVRRVVKIMLTREGYTVHTVSDGNEAIAYYDEHADDIDLMLLDIVMPHAGGRVAAKHVLERNPDMPIFFLTGYDNQEHAGQSIAGREIEIIEKPFHNDDLLARVRRKLDQAKPGRAGA